MVKCHAEIEKEYVDRFSIAVCVCVPSVHMLIRASTAEQPEIDPNCFGSSFSWMDSRIQFAKKILKF